MQETVISTNNILQIKSYRLYIKPNCSQEQNSPTFLYRVDEESIIDLHQNDKRSYDCSLTKMSFDKLKDNLLYVIFNSPKESKHQRFLYDDSIDNYPIRIVIHSANDLLQGQASVKDKVYHYAQELLYDNNKNIPIPLIHITLIDSFVNALYGDESLPKLMTRSFQIMDNSIWNYLVPLFDIHHKKTKEKDVEIVKFQESFFKAVESIYRNYEKHLYDLQVAKEYADLNARLITEAYLSGAHAKGVSPFIFHSEGVIKKMIKEEFEDKENNIIEEITKRKWRILLVDDKANNKMVPKNIFLNDKDDCGFSWNCKIKIIRELLIKHLHLTNENVRVRGFVPEVVKLKKEHPNAIVLAQSDSKESLLAEADYVSSTSVLNLIEEHPAEEYIVAVDADFFQNIQLQYPKTKFYQVPNSNIDHDRCRVLIEYVENLDSAKEALKNKEYDLILLDYLLDNHEYGYELLDDIFYHITNKKEINKLRRLIEDLQNRYDAIHNQESNNKQEDSFSKVFWDIQWNSKLVLFINRYKNLKNIYDECIEKYKSGHDEAIKYLLDKLWEEQKDYRIGPCNRFFFMFISAYSSAVYERLLAEGLNQSEDYWHIAMGACPTNTPQLFLYNLIKLMEKRIVDSHIRKLSIDGIIETLGKIFNEDGLTRKYAGEYYQDIQSYQYYYRSILRDYKVSFNKNGIFETEGSVLMTDFMNSNVNLGGLLEHIAQLVHLTAFGTIRQWPEMWEEYIYFKSLLSSQIKSDNKEFDDLCGNIENYIKSLKSSAL